MRSVAKWMAAIVVMVLLQNGEVFPQAQASRDQTRRKLGQLLDTIGPNVNMTFQVAKETEWTYVGILTNRLIYADKMEVYLLVTDQDEIRVQVFPMYKGSYINLEKVKDSAGLTRRLLGINVNSFLFWGVDRSNDIFAAFTFTLESGFPSEAIEVVLKSIIVLDKSIGELRQYIDK